MSNTNGQDKRAKPMREVGVEETFRQRNRLMTVIVVAAIFFQCVAVVARIYGDFAERAEIRAEAAETDAEVPDAR